MVSGTATLVAGATGANATGLTTGLGRAAGVAEMGRGAYNLWNTWGTYDPRTNREDTAQATEGAQQLLHGGLATWGASSPIGSAAALGAGIGNMMVTHADALAQRENRYGANPNALLTERGANARGVAASGSGCFATSSSKIVLASNSGCSSNCFSIMSQSCSKGSFRVRQG
jgi:hypothetical protein